MGLALRTSAVLAAILLAGGAGNLALFLWGSSPYGEYRTVDVGGEQREYLLHVPANVGTDADPVPLVVAMHPLGGWSHQFARVTQWASLADEEGFIVVFPDALGPVRHIGQGWNAGHCCGYGFERGTDDVAFLDALLDELLADLPVDASRTYLVGHSNGAMMAHHYAALRSQRVAAAGAVAGAVASGPTQDQLVATPAPAGAVSFAIVHGTLDAVVPFDGRPTGDRSGWRFAPVQESVDFWREPAGATGDGMVTDLGGGTLQVTYEGPNATVQFTAVAGGRHGWPGGVGNPLRGPPSGDVGATRLLWSFFEGRTGPAGEAQAPSGTAI